MSQPPEPSEREAPLLPVPREAPLLPARLTPFAPADPDAEDRTRGRVRDLSLNQLRERRDRIDRRVFELGLQIGDPALAIPSVRGTGLIDLDRILRKLDRLSEAREQADLEREVDRAEGGLLSKLDLSWVSDLFRSREIRTRRRLLTSELGLALCAADPRVLGEYSPHVKRLLDNHVAQARRIDELFLEMRIVDEELERRRQDGVAAHPPKEIDALLERALDSVDDVSSRVGGRLAELGLKAAQSAAQGGGQAAWALAKGAAQGAKSLATRRRASPGEEEGPEPAPRETAPPEAAPASGPSPSEVPELIRELARLRNEGLLTDEEFRRKKADLLRRL